MALFDKNKPFIGVRIYDYLLEVWERFDSTPSNNDLSAVNTAASNAQTSANNAQTSANTANTNAGNAQTSANNAQSTANNAASTATTALSTAQNATGRLAGDNDYFEGTGTFTGTPNNFIVASITAQSAVGINYSLGYFNFSYLGKYAIWITQGGDCVNTRSDWYQEVRVSLKEAVLNNPQPFTFKTIPPSGTWNMENTNSNLIDVQAGNQWKVVINMTTGGSTTNGTFKIKIKKVI